MGLIMDWVTVPWDTESVQLYLIDTVHNTLFSSFDLPFVRVLNRKDLSTGG